MAADSSALVLFAHGARDPRWAEPFEAVAAKVRAAEPGRRVTLAYLELMQPSLGDAIDALASEGHARIDVVPMFLGTGGHLRKDLPPLVEAARVRHAQITICLHAAIGEQAAVTEAMASAALALAARGPR